jgi:arsenate reductase
MGNNPKKRKTRVLFVCIGNACRSQLAEALAKHTAFDVIESSSGGLSPLGSIAPLVEKVLEERGVPCEDQHSKAVSAAACKNADIIVNMSGAHGDRVFPKGRAAIEDWAVDDPYGLPVEAYREACDEIEARLAEFAARLRAKASANQAR